MDVDIFGQDEETANATKMDWESLGGILLSPIFWLVNFVADAIMDALGNFMEPNTDNFSLGVGVLTMTPNNEGYDAENAIPVDTSEFAPDVTGIVSGDSFQYPNLHYTPQEIFSGEIDLLSIDFISGKDSQGNDVTDTGWNAVREVIRDWYKVLRLVAIIGLLSVLIYTGIKILISANAKDKAKYKEWIMNWLMAVAILFAMHYIMAFIISVTGAFSSLLDEACQVISINPKTGGQPFTTNLMGLVRFMVQSENFYVKVGYEVMYIALVVYTIKFTFIYLKRVLNMAFLTLIAPIVALTYPIDKINDGKAQGFDMWVKEYIFNALLQPMHYILYYILVGSSVTIAATNPIYGIVVLAFMTEAERILKKIFGFDKAGNGTVGGLATAFTVGAIASKVGSMAKLSGLASGNGGKDGAGSSNDILKGLKPTDTDTDADNALFADSNQPNALLGDSSESQTDTGTGNSGRFNIGNERNNIESERRALEEMGAGIDWENDTDDMVAYAQLNREIEEREARFAQQEAERQSAQRQQQQQQRTSQSNRVIRGVKAVGSQVFKPIWDSEQDAAYNMKRLAKKGGRAVLGASLGVAAAAVQAGISITDGKYNPMEAVGTIAAGYAGAGQLTKAMGGLIDTYRDGRDAGDKQAMMRRALSSWNERQDVIDYNKKYNENDREAVLGIQKQLLTQGVTDLKEMDKCIKYIKANNGGQIQGASNEMIRKARVLNDFDSEVSERGINPFKPKEVQQYIDTVARNDEEKMILRNKFNALVGYKEDIKK